MRSMPYRIAVAGVCIFCLWVASPGRAATLEQVQASIEKAKQYLHNAQNGNGNWEVSATPLPAEKGHSSIKGPQWGGLTSIATYALLASGENPQDPRMVKPIWFLKNVRLVGTYAVSLRCLALNELADRQGSHKQMRAFVVRDAEALYFSQHRNKGADMGLHTYYAMPFLRSPLPAAYDHSNSQMAVLGMWACQQLRVEIPLDYWKFADFGWKSHQWKNGAWGYKLEDRAFPNGRATITAAGAATLFITQDMLDSNAGIDCRGNIHNPHIDAALQWLHQNFALITTQNPPWAYYGLYAVERIGLASGLKYFGTFNWYQSGADYLLQHQRPDGGWGSGVHDTAFGLLFLVRGIAPVLMSKLQYEFDPALYIKKEPHWNERPRDSANFTRWMARTIERPLNWQIVNLRVPVAELHDAPILYIAGNQELKFSKDHLDKLKQFIEEGGMIFANADCTSDDFSKSIRKMCNTMFPLYEFRTLPLKHPIYTNQLFLAKNWRNPPAIKGLSNGVREMVILFDRGDPGKYWQRCATGSDDEMLQAAADVILYAVDKQQLRYRGQSILVEPKPGAGGGPPIKVARLQYNGNWNPEPIAWRQFAAMLHNQNTAELTVETVKLGEGQLDGFKVAHLTGTTSVTFTKPIREQLRKFIEDGGTLIIDAAGGAAEFCTGIETELAVLFPNQVGQLKHSLPEDHPAFATGPGKLEIGYRPYARKMLGTSATLRMKGIEVNGRICVLYSPVDLTAGLVGNSVDGIIGYEPKTCIDLMTRMILWASQNQ